MKSIAISHKGISEEFYGDHVSYNLEKGFCHNRPIISFLPSLSGSLWWFVGVVGDRLRLYLYGVPPTATALLEILISENYRDEETDQGRKLMGSIKINPKIANAFMGALF